MNLNQTQTRYKLIKDSVTAIHLLIPKLKAPIPIEEIIKSYCSSINYEFYSESKDLDDKFSGQFIATNNVLGILFNSNHHIHRQRFTISHEFGHFILGHGVDLQNKLDIIDIESKKPEEVEANIFASYFLMPTNLLKPQVEGVTNYNLNALSEKYQVSPEAVRLRLLHDSDLIGYKEEYSDRIRKINTPLALEDDFGSSEVF